MAAIVYIWGLCAFSVQIRALALLLRGREEVSRHSHKVEIAGSNPAPRNHRGIRQLADGLLWEQAALSSNLSSPTRGIYNPFS